MRKPAIFRFESEAAMCAAFIADADRQGYDAYPETGGFDIVLVHRLYQWQIGVEAKQTFNAGVLLQAADGIAHHWNTEGPDFRAVLTPAGGDAGLAALARHIGITAIRAYGRPDDRGYAPNPQGGWSRAFRPDLPDQHNVGDSAGGAPGRFFCGGRDWFELCPPAPIALPDYIPDVAAGAPSPIALTHWKVAAIKIAIVLERRGHVTGADFKALGISSSRWLQMGWLVRADRRWVAGALPDFRGQHPRNYAEIEADFDQWAAALPGMQNKISDERAA